MDFWTDVERIAYALSGLSYFDLLGLEPDALTDASQPTALVDAYHDALRRYHPDRFAARSTREQQIWLAKICARIGEAYRVLSAPASRADYLAQLDAGEPHARTKRATKAAFVETRDPKSEKARVLLERARVLASTGNDAGALAKLDLALQYEPDSVALNRARRKLAGDPEGASSGEEAK